MKGALVLTVSAPTRGGCVVRELHDSIGNPAPSRRAVVVGCSRGLTSSVLASTEVSQARSSLRCISDICAIGHGNEMIFLELSKD